MGYKIKEILEDKEVRAEYVRDYADYYDRMHGYED